MHLGALLVLLAASTVQGPPVDEPPPADVDEGVELDEPPVEDEDDGRPAVNPLRGALVTGGVTAAASALSGVLPATCCSTCGCVGPCAAGACSSLVVPPGALLGAWLADAVESRAADPRRLVAAASLGGFAAVAGGLASAVLVVVAMGVAGFPALLVTQDAKMLAAAAALAGALAGLVFFGGDLVLASSLAAFGYYAAATLE